MNCRHEQTFVKDIMTSNPACCTPDQTLEVAAQLMVDFDCGEIPVVTDLETGFPIGVITDRDIICRAIAKGLNARETTVAKCMSTPLVVLTPEDSIAKCSRILEENQIRRAPVIDPNGACIGIISLADIALHVARAESGEILREVSHVTPLPSRVRGSWCSGH